MKKLTKKHPTVAQIHQLCEGDQYWAPAVGSENFVVHLGGWTSIWRIEKTERGARGLNSRAMQCELIGVDALDGLSDEHRAACLERKGVV